MPSKHDFTFTLLMNTDTGAYLLQMTLPDGRQVVRDVASEDEARRVIDETMTLIRDFYAANGVEGDWSEGPEVRHDSKPSTYMN
jgi:hypothetical protein